MTIGNWHTLCVDGSVTAVAAYDKGYGVHDVVLNRVENVHPLQAESWVVVSNPSKDAVINVQMNLREGKTIVFRLVDNTGRVLLVKQVEGVKGSNNFILREQSQLPNGTYYLQAAGIDGEEVKKIIDI